MKRFGRCWSVWKKETGFELFWWLLWITQTEKKKQFQTANINGTISNIRHSRLCSFKGSISCKIRFTNVFKLEHLLSVSQVPRNQKVHPLRLLPAPLIQKKDICVKCAENQHFVTSQRGLMHPWLSFRSLPSCLSPLPNMWKVQQIIGFSRKLKAQRFFCRKLQTEG